MMESTRHKADAINVGDVERLASLLGGGALLAYGLKRRTGGALLLAAAGGALVQRGMSGHSYLYQAFGIHNSRRGRSASASVPYELGVRIDRAITVGKPPQELYDFWRNLENLPRFARYVESVQPLDNGRSRWVVKTPAGKRYQWEAEIHNEEPGRLIAWRTVPGSQVQIGGAVRFQPASGNRGTEVKVELQYNPPGGFVGAALAKLMRSDPASLVQEDLRRFKMLMEAGEIPTVEGQPAGADRGGGQRSGSLAPVGETWRDAVQEASEESFPASDPPSWTPAALRS